MKGTPQLDTTATGAGRERGSARVGVGMKKKKIFIFVSDGQKHDNTWSEDSIENILASTSFINVYIGETENCVDFVCREGICSVIMTPEETRNLARFTTKPIHSEVLN